MGRKSSHARWKDDPTSFGLRWPRIVEEFNVRHSPLARVRQVRYYAMGKCKIIFSAPDSANGYFLSIRRADRYPTWDEIVWIRYNLIPDSARMALILPNLNNYINDEDTDARNTFTMEQAGWALDPQPTCGVCNVPLHLIHQGIGTGLFECPRCKVRQHVDFLTWNEQHGNGFHKPALKGDAS